MNEEKTRDEQSDETGTQTFNAENSAYSRALVKMFANMLHGNYRTFPGIKDILTDALCKSPEICGVEHKIRVGEITSHTGTGDFIFDLHIVHPEDKREHKSTFQLRIVELTQVAEFDEE